MLEELIDAYLPPSLYLPLKNKDPLLYFQYKTSRDYLIQKYGGQNVHSDKAGSKEEKRLQKRFKALRKENLQLLGIVKKRLAKVEKLEEECLVSLKAHTDRSESIKIEEQPYLIQDESDTQEMLKEADSSIIPKHQDDSQQVEEKAAQQTLSLLEKEVENLTKDNQKVQELLKDCLEIQYLEISEALRNTNTKYRQLLKGGKTVTSESQVLERISEVVPLAEESQRASLNRVASPIEWETVQSEFYSPSMGDASPFTREGHTSPDTLAQSRRTNNNSVQSTSFLRLKSQERM